MKKGIQPGDKFGRLTVVSDAVERDKPGQKKWECVCDCGTTKKVLEQNLKSGNTKSCGCFRKEVAHRKPDCVDGTTLRNLTQKLNKNNTSGAKGIFLTKKGLWKAHIGFRNKNYHLGYFSNIQDAIKARQRAEEELFYPIIEKYDKEMK